MLFVTFVTLLFLCYATTVAQRETYRSQRSQGSYRSLSCSETNQNGWFCGSIGSKTKLCVDQEKIFEYSCGSGGCIQGQCDTLGFCENKLNGWYKAQWENDEGRVTQTLLYCQANAKNPVNYIQCLEGFDVTPAEMSQPKTQFQKKGRHFQLV